MTLLDHVSTSTARPSAASRHSTWTTPLGGSYVTTSRTGSGSRTEGTYVTTHGAAPARRGGYVSTASELRPSGGFYTFSG